MNDNHPSCIHSRTLHNTMSMSNSQSAMTGSSLCSCEECSRYKVPFQSLSSDQTSDIFDMLQQQNTNSAMSSAHDRNNSNSNSNPSGTSSTSPPTTYLARRPSTTATSPKVAGYGGATMMQPHLRRASFEFHNRERSFQQHSAACDCRGSGVGCGCSFTCDC